MKKETKELIKLIIVWAVSTIIGVGIGAGILVIFKPFGPFG